MKHHVGKKIPKHLNFMLGLEIFRNGLEEDYDVGVMPFQKRIFRCEKVLQVYVLHICVKPMGKAQTQLSVTDNSTREVPLLKIFWCLFLCIL